MNSKSIASQKRKIREFMAKLRKNMAPDEIQTLSALAQEVLMRSEAFQSAKSIGAYHAIGAEVRTDLMIDKALDQGKLVALPRTENGQIRFYEFSSPTELVPGGYGIKEPPAGRPAVASQIDLLIVPGLAFDYRGHRLGYGKGYYDNYLRTSPVRLSVGLGYSFQLVDELPADHEHDVKLKGLATETGLIYF